MSKHLNNKHKIFEHRDIILRNIILLAHINKLVFTIVQKSLDILDIISFHIYISKKKIVYCIL